MSNINNKVPDILRQKLLEVEGTSMKLILQNASDQPIFEAPLNGIDSFDIGDFLIWKGLEIGLFYMVKSPGSLYIYDYRAGTENAKLILDHQFGRTAVITDVLYFPLAIDKPGIVVAVADRSMEKHGDYLAYISLSTKRLLKSFYMPHQITKIYSILDGTAGAKDFGRLANSFHKSWPHILLVGCRFGYVSLVQLDLLSEEDQPILDVLPNVSDSPLKAQKPSGVTQPLRPKKVVHISKIFCEDEMFVFRADDGATRCLQKDRVSVSALHWNDKVGLAIIGFNFGGVMLVSLRTSKVFSLIYIDSAVRDFAIQEPEEDPRPILYFWIAYNNYRQGAYLLLCNINFPKDEEYGKEAREYTYLEPSFSPWMKWNVDSCTRLITMRTILMKKRNPASQSQPTNIDPYKKFYHHECCERTIPSDSSLLFVAWLELEKNSGNFRHHGALFDLNAFYAKRLVPKIQPDSTIAAQIPFLARFREDAHSAQQIMSFMPSNVNHFAPPAFLNESIDQLYYPSTNTLTINCLAKTRVFQMKVRPIQIQLITFLSQNIVAHFECPDEPVRWICAVGLANSTPSSNTNEQRACLLRIIVHSFFPAIMTLIDAAAQNQEWMKFIQKWVWKEVEITKTKFDDLCSPLFSDPPNDPSPSARGFIQHARVFFKRASLIFAKLNSKAMELTDEDYCHSTVIQGKVVRQISLYSASIAFALAYHLLPVDKLNSLLYEVVANQFAKRVEKARTSGKKMEIHALLDEIIKLNPEEEVWQMKSSMEWYPPRNFNSFLPIMLMVNVHESAKLALVGYYCLDLELAALTFASDVDAKNANTPPSSRIYPFTSLDSEDVHRSFHGLNYSTLFLSFLLQEQFSLEEMNRIKALWLEDKKVEQIVEEISKTKSCLTMGTSQQKADDDREERLKCLPFSNAQQIYHCQKQFLDLEWGVYKYNLEVLRRRRYNLLMDMPPLSGREPEFVRNCYLQCAEVRRRFPSLFKKVQPLPQYAIQQYNKVSQQSAHPRIFSFHGQLESAQNQPVLSLSIKQSDLSSIIGTQSAEVMPPTAIINRKRAPSTVPFYADNNNQDDETELYEELPLTIATPRKRQTLFFDEAAPNGTPANGAGEEWFTRGKEGTPLRSPVACNIIRKESVKSKDWDKITKVTQTPLSLRKSISQSRIPMRQHKSRARTALFRSVTSTDGARKGAGKGRPHELQLELEMDSAASPSSPDRLTPPSSISKQPNQPSSILKSNKHESRLPSQLSSSKPKLRFATSLFTTESIPSRAEKAMDERHNTSFSNFASLTASDDGDIENAYDSRNANDEAEPADKAEDEAEDEGVALADRNLENGKKLVDKNADGESTDKKAAEESGKLGDKLTADVAEGVGEPANNVDDHDDGDDDDDWLQTNMRPTRRSTRVRKAPEHFEPAPPSPVRRSSSRQGKENSPSPSLRQKTPPPLQTPPSARKRGRNPVAVESQSQEHPPEHDTSSSSRKKGRHSASRDA